MNDNINDLTELTPSLPPNNSTVKDGEIIRLQDELKTTVELIAKSEFDKATLAKATELIRIAESNLKNMQLAAKDAEIVKIKEELKRAIEELNRAFEQLEENKKI